TKGNDPHGPRTACKSGDAVGLEARAGDDAFRLIVSGDAHDAPSACIAPDGAHLRRGDDLPALRANFRHERRADRRIIGDSLLWNMHRGDARGMRLDFPQLFPVQPPQSMKPVLRAALE